MPESGLRVDLHPDFHWGPELVLTPADESSAFPELAGPVLGVSGATFVCCDLARGSVYAPGLAANAVCPPARDPVHRRVLLADHEGLVALDESGQSATRLTLRPKLAYDRAGAELLGADPNAGELAAEFDWLLQVRSDGSRVACQLTLPDGQHQFYMLDERGWPRQRFGTGKAWLHVAIDDDLACLVGFRGGLELIDLERLGPYIGDDRPQPWKRVDTGLATALTDCAVAPGRSALAFAGEGRVFFIEDVAGACQARELVGGGEAAPTMLAWAPDGQHLWATRGTTALWRVRPDADDPEDAWAAIVQLAGGAGQESANEAGASGQRALVSACGRYIVASLIGLDAADESSVATLTGPLPFGLGGIDLALAQGPRPVEYHLLIDLEHRRVQRLRGLPQGQLAWLAPTAMAAKHAGTPDRLALG